MRARYRILLLIVILTVIVSAVTGVTIYTLYSTALDEEATRLTETAQSWARIIEAVGAYDRQHGVLPDFSDSTETTLEQVRKAHGRFQGFGLTGEFTLARKEGGQIVFLLSHRHADMGNPESVPINADIAEPMRRALRGESGTLVGLDYRGETVLAAHEPVDVLDLGIVAKIDLAEVRAPFIRAGLQAGAAGLALVCLGSLLFLRIGGPMVQSIREGEEQFRQVSEQSLTGIFIHQNGQVLYVNPCLAQMLNYDPNRPHEYIGMPFIEFVHPEEREKVAGYVVRRLKGENVPDRYTTRLLTRGGQQVWVEVMVNLIEVGGEPAAMGNILDITPRKEAEEALIEERNRAQNYLDIADVMLVAIDSGGRVTMINRKGCEVLGRPEAEIVGRNWFDNFLPERLRDEVQSVSQMILRGEIGPVKTYENPVLTSSGEERIIAWHNVDIGDDGGAVIGHLSSGEDVTERKAAEQEKEALEDQLRQAMKMEAIGRLAGGVAHDFNNILTAIIGYAELVRSKISPHDPIGPDLDEIQGAGERAAALTGQLLAFSRKQIVVPKVIDLNTVIERGNRMISRIIGEDIELLFIPAEATSTVRMDPSQVDQLLINLATNARDAMPDGGKLTIETAPQSFSLDTRRRADEEIAPGDYVMVAVSDSGSGMDPKTRDKIFEPFFSTKPKDRGTGLGLSTVYGIVKQAGGYIGVYSEPGLGSTFKMYFPRVYADVQETGHSAVQEHPRGSETVLLVEDEEMVRTLTVRILEKQGYRVITAGSGDEAIRRCRKADGEVDLLLTDVIMPAMNGHDLFINLSERHPDLKVLYMSGYTDEVVARHGILEEGTLLLAKPFSLRDVSRAVRRALDET